jgi:hypothetical protein
MSDLREALEKPPLHNLLICSGPVCVRECPNHKWADRNDLIGKTRQRYEGETR